MNKQQILISKFDGNSISAVLDTKSQSAWFKGIEVAAALGYVNPKSTIHKKVKPDEKKRIHGLSIQNGYPGQSHWITYINEVGLYRLIFSSKLPSAEKFKTWVFTEVLPNLRKANLLDRNILFNETDLHYNVVKFIKLHYSDIKLLPGLGEYQHTKGIRWDAWSNGYSGGQPDIVISLAVKEYNGLAIEFKKNNGKGIVSAKQKGWHTYHSEQGYLVIVGSNYKKLTMVISSYLDRVRLSCQKCRKFYKGPRCLSNHNVKSHSKTNFSSTLRNVKNLLLILKNINMFLSQ